jgi:hypothetical protein
MDLVDDTGRVRRVVQHAVAVDDVVALVADGQLFRVMVDEFAAERAKPEISLAWFRWPADRSRSVTRVPLAAIRAPAAAAARDGALSSPPAEDRRTHPAWPFGATNRYPLT